MHGPHCRALEAARKSSRREVSVSPQAAAGQRSDDPGAEGGSDLPQRPLREGYVRRLRPRQPRPAIATDQHGLEGVRRRTSLGEQPPRVCRWLVEIDDARTRPDDGDQGAIGIAVAGDQADSGQGLDVVHHGWPAPDALDRGRSAGEVAGVPARPPARARCCSTRRSGSGRARPRCASRSRGPPGTLARPGRARRCDESRGRRRAAR